jgi:hypothetical protein
MSPLLKRGSGKTSMRAEMSALQEGICLPVSLDPR